MEPETSRFDYTHIITYPKTGDVRIVSGWDDGQKNTMYFKDYPQVPGQPDSIWRYNRRRTLKEMLSLRRANSDVVCEFHVHDGKRCFFKMRDNRNNINPEE